MHILRVCLVSSPRRLTWRSVGAGQADPVPHKSKQFKDPNSICPLQSPT